MRTGRVFLPPNTGTFGSYGRSGGLRGAAVVFLCVYRFRCRFDRSSGARNPQKDMPHWILGSLVICHLPLYRGFRAC